ncbi:MAG: DUF5372 family protein, partial [Pseudonocardiaceae bacterium]
MTSVVITRRRHPLEGLALRVLGRMRRHGRLELLLVLPDGSKSLIPAGWTDLQGADADGETGQDVAATLGSLADLLAACAVVAALSGGEPRGQAARQSPSKEDSRAACAAESAAGPGSGATPRSSRPASLLAGRRGDHAAG